MKINKITLNNFKSFYGKHEILFDDNITFLLGLNGTGKSNFLESILFLNSDNISNSNEIYMNLDFYKKEKKIEYSAEIEIDYSNNSKKISTLINDIFVEYI
ncbi:MAG: AAA family ATPase [Clostridia bacterium]